MVPEIGFCEHLGGTVTLYCMGRARGARAPVPQLVGMLLAMGMYDEDCGEGAGGAGEPHVGEILGAGEPRRADATWREERGRSISSAPSR